MSEQIIKTLDLSPVVESGSVKAISVEDRIPRVDSENVDRDFSLAKENILTAIDQSLKSIEDMATVAKSSQHPRAYEVLDKMLKTLSDLNKDLVGLHERKRDALGATPDSPSTINQTNNMIVGTTLDISKMIEEKLNKARGVTDEKI